MMNIRICYVGWIKSLICGFSTYPIQFSFYSAYFCRQVNCDKIPFLLFTWVCWAHTLLFKHLQLTSSISIVWCTRLYMGISWERKDIFSAHGIWIKFSIRANCPYSGLLSTFGLLCCTPKFRSLLFSSYNEHNTHFQQKISNYHHWFIGNANISPLVCITPWSPLHAM